MMSTEEFDEATEGEVMSDGSGDEKISPFQAAYMSNDPVKYANVGRPLFYSPEPPALPDFASVVLDCAVLFGNSSLAAMYGWKFPRTCEFWERKIPLTEEERNRTVLNKRLKMIGLDSRQAAVNYSLSMNIIDHGIVQNFEEKMSEETRAALNEADVWILQQCLSYMPFENLQIWIEAFLKDRSRPKRFIYDFNPYFDSRDMTPATVLAGVEGWKVSAEKFYAYRQKTDEEFANNQENGRGMCVHHYVVDFDALPEA